MYLQTFYMYEYIMHVVNTCTARTGSCATLLHRCCLCPRHRLRRLHRAHWQHHHHHILQRPSSSRCEPASCLSAYAAADPLPFTEPSKSSAWRDPAQDLDTRVDALVKALTDDEKSGLFLNGAGGARLGIPKYNWWSERSTASHVTV